MNIRYIEYKNINKQKWDNCISFAVNGNIYAYSWYLDAVCDQWDALVEGDYETVFPLTWRRKFGIHYLYQPPFSQQLGIFSKGRLSPDRVDQFLASIPGKFRLVEIQLNSFNTPSRADVEIRMRPNLMLDLIQPYEEIRKGYAQNLKRNLKKAEESAWTVREEASLGQIISLFRENRGKNLGTLSDEDYLRLITIATETKRRAQLLLLGTGVHENTLNAGAVFVSTHKKIILLFSASDPLAREHGGMSLLLDNIIKNYSGDQYILDFEGSEDPNLARFYQGFGAVKSDYPQIRKENLPYWVKIGRKILRFFLYV